MESQIEFVDLVSVCATPRPPSVEPSVEAHPTAPSSPPSFGRKILTFLYDALASAHVATEYVFKSNARDIRGFLIGLITVFFVVTFVNLLQNSIKKSPVVFMKLSENTVAEFDLLVSPKVSKFITFTFSFLYSHLIFSFYHSHTLFLTGVCFIGSIRCNNKLSTCFLQ